MARADWWLDHLGRHGVCRFGVWQFSPRYFPALARISALALYCIRPDLIDCATLEEIGELAGRSRQAVYKVADSFRLTTGFEP